MTSLRVRPEFGPLVEGSLKYIQSEYSFKFEIGGLDALIEREGFRGRSSVLVGTLQVEVDVEKGSALYVWGFHQPMEKWRGGSLSEPRAESGALLFDADFEEGISKEAAPVGAWTTVFDRSNGWLRIAPDDQPDSLVAIATNTLLGYREGRFHSIWLKPLMKEFP